MATLEEKIAALLNTTDAVSEQELTEAVTKVDKDGNIVVKGGKDVAKDADDDLPADDDADADDKGSADDDNNDAEKGDRDGDTDVSKDAGDTKKNKVKVVEAATPGQMKDIAAAGGDDATNTKTEKIRAKLAKRDARAAKLADTAKPDTQNDAGDNARIQSGKRATGTGESHKIDDGATNKSAVDSDNARNNAMTNEQHMDALFSGETLSEEFKTKAATIFEAAVVQAAQSHLDELAEQYNAELALIQEETEVKLNEAVEEAVGEMVDSVDEFLNVVVENWVSDNRVALEGGVKIELMNSFVDGLKNLFKEHYVEVPNKKLNIIDEQAKEIDALSEMAVDLNKENEALGAEVSKLKAKLVFESASDKMTDIQKEKFWTLAENVAFTDENDYSAKLKTIKESYFSTGRNVSNDDSKTIVEAPKGMDQYVSAITQNVKFI